MKDEIERKTLQGTGMKDPYASSTGETETTTYDFSSLTTDLRQPKKVLLDVGLTRRTRCPKVIGWEGMDEEGMNQEALG